MVQVVNSMRVIAFVLSLSKGERLSRSWFDKALLSADEGLTTNDLNVKLSRLKLVANIFLLPRENDKLRTETKLS